jgi:hypothetical protein
MPYPPGVTEADIEGGTCPSVLSRHTYECETCHEICDVENATEDAYALQVCEMCLPDARTAALQMLVEYKLMYARLRRRIEEALEGKR